MADEWYYAVGNEQRGPVTWEALQALARGGEVNAQTLVWMAGMPQWQPAASVMGLTSGVAPLYAPPQAFAPPGAPGLSYYSPREDIYAGFWLRVCASIVDWLVLGLPFLVLGRMIAAPTPVFMPGRPVAMPPQMLMVPCGLQLIQIAASWLYFALMESSARQATLGKMALGLKVTDGAGQRINFGRATGRFFGKYLSMLTLGVGYIMAGLTERKQALHDFVADTLVIRA